MIRTTIQGKVSLLSMEFGRGNAIDFAFLDAMHGALDEVLRGDTGAAVVTSGGRAFCAGLDLVKIYELDQPTMTRFVEAFDALFVRLFSFPRPVVAAVNGHAIAGGAIMAMAADERLMASGGHTIGLTEVELGIPLPAGAFEIARYALRPEVWTRALMEGKKFTTEEAHAIGLVDRVIAPEELVRAAVERAEHLASRPRAAVARIKAELKAPALERAAARREAALSAFLEAWFGPDARAGIGAMRDALMKKKAGG